MYPHPPPQVLLGTNTVLSGRLSGGTSFVVPAGESEVKLLHLCSSIIQNIALHPQNRTRLYKVRICVAPPKIKYFLLIKPSYIFYYFLFVFLS